eukprot:s2919_g5.t1
MGKRAGAKPGGSAQNRPAAKGGLPKRKPRGGQGGGYKAEDFQDLVSQLKPLGLAVLKMDADGILGTRKLWATPALRNRVGNCLFRSVADQLCGDANEHQSYRDKCCEHMLDHAEEFSLFYVADDFESSCDSFESYVYKMRRPGTWGSQLELMALCQSYGVNAIVHQSGLPSYEMVFSPQESPCMQISYHDGEHFNSVRFAWDLEGPVKHFSLAQLKGNGEKMKGLVEQVTYSLPPEHGFDETTMRQTLLQAKEDVDLAVELLLKKMTITDGEEPASEPAAEGGDPKEAAPSTGTSSNSTRPRAEKRQERKAKAAAKKKGKAEVKEKESQDTGEPDQEAMKQLLCKQLLTVLNPPKFEDFSDLRQAGSLASQQVAELHDLGRLLFELLLPSSEAAKAAVQAAKQLEAVRPSELFQRLGVPGCDASAAWPAAAAHDVAVTALQCVLAEAAGTQPPPGMTNVAGMLLHQCQRSRHVEGASFSSIEVAFDCTFSSQLDVQSLSVERRFWRFPPLGVGHALGPWPVGRQHQVELFVQLVPDRRLCSSIGRTHFELWPLQDAYREGSWFWRTEKQALRLVPLSQNPILVDGKKVAYPSEEEVLIFDGSKVSFSFQDEVFLTLQFLLGHTRIEAAMERAKSEGSVVPEPRESPASYALQCEELLGESVEDFSKEDRRIPLLAEGANFIGRMSHPSYFDKLQRGAPQGRPFLPFVSRRHLQVTASWYDSSEPPNKQRFEVVNWSNNPISVAGHRLGEGQKRQAQVGETIELLGEDGRGGVAPYLIFRLLWLGAGRSNLSLASRSTLLPAGAIFRDRFKETDCLDREPRNAKTRPPFQLILAGTAVVKGLPQSWRVVDGLSTGLTVGRAHQRELHEKALVEGVLELDYFLRHIAAMAKIQGAWKSSEEDAWFKHAVGICWHLLAMPPSEDGSADAVKMPKKGKAKRTSVAPEPTSIGEASPKADASSDPKAAWTEDTFGAVCEVEFLKRQYELIAKARALGSDEGDAKEFADFKLIYDRGPKESKTALYVAACYEKPRIAVLLLQAHADVHEGEHGGKVTPLHAAADYETRMTKGIEVLLKARADPNRLDDQGMTPLHRALLPRFFVSRERVVKQLIEAEADVNLPLGVPPEVEHEDCQGKTEDFQGKTPLFVAVAYRHKGRWEVAAVLLEAACNLDVKSMCIIIRTEGPSAIDCLNKCPKPAQMNLNTFGHSMERAHIWEQLRVILVRGRLSKDKDTRSTQPFDFGHETHKEYLQLKSQNLFTRPEVQASLKYLPGVCASDACNSELLEALADTTNEEIFHTDVVAALVQAAWMQTRVSTACDVFLSLLTVALLCHVSFTLRHDHPHSADPGH